ncbi:LysR family transcriptional regulator [Undibacterium sp. TS12]|uniref:LysR family transcriptional regulator n=1 Tax=Undibacterium sp. TS12 TaxID=2908202 RepID=UPI001F4CC6D1|nr:LysR family transcriptional regulator [Undibacterium sp. TS12]MCH8622194.1 LysR family transcriptional regulator [Undibacterium sp. TS12]
METLSSIESFVRSAEAGSFSQAARNLGLTPAAVSKNVAKLESRLGIRLFQRSTRSLALTEEGEIFLAQVRSGLDSIQAALANVENVAGKPAGILKISLALSFGRDYVLPLVHEFVQKYPEVIPDLHFDNRNVDLIGEGFDVAIGGGIELVPGVVAREIGRAHVIPVASPAYLAEHGMPARPDDLIRHDGILRRSPQSGRLRSWTLRNARGEEAPVELRARIMMDDPEAMCRAALLGMGVAMVPRLHALPYLDSGELQRLLPAWHADIGPLAMYYASGRLMPARTRLFVDFILKRFKERDIAGKFSALPAKK